MSRELLEHGASIEMDASPASVKFAENATVDEMLSISGFKQVISGKQKNKFKRHNVKEANKRLDERNAAIIASLMHD
jgi:hypothetical protein